MARYSVDCSDTIPEVNRRNSANINPVDHLEGPQAKSSDNTAKAFLNDVTLTDSSRTAGPQPRPGCEHVDIPQMPAFRPTEGRISDLDPYWATAPIPNLTPPANWGNPISIGPKTLE